MVSPVPPDHLTTPVALFEDYLNRSPGTPFLALGDYGTGRGHWLRLVLESRNLHPIWLTEPTEVPEFDLEDRRLFPIYDLTEPSIPPTAPSVILASRDFKRVDAFKDLDWTMFPVLPAWEREAFLAAQGLPQSLGDGNPTYSSLLLAGDAYRVSGGVEVHAGPPENPTWEAWRAGGESPLVNARDPETLLAYYSGYAFPPDQWWPNRNLGYERKISANVFRRILVEQIRLEWPEGKVPYPEVLKEPRQDRPRGSRKNGATPVSVPPTALSADYKVVWD